MATSNKYKVCLSPSGWAVYEKATGQKVRSFSGRAIGREQALAYMYELNGWKLPAGGFRL